MGAALLVARHDAATPGMIALMFSGGLLMYVSGYLRQRWWFAVLAFGGFGMALGAAIWGTIEGLPLFWITPMILEFVLYGATGAYREHCATSDVIESVQP